MLSTGHRDWDNRGFNPGTSTRGTVLGGGSDALWPRFGETHRQLLAWLPHAEGYVLPGVTHFLQLENPRGMAEALAAFYSRYPLGGAAKAGPSI